MRIISFLTQKQAEEIAGDALIHVHALSMKEDEIDKACRWGIENRDADVIGMLAVRHGDGSMTVTNIIYGKCK
jgi:hypothetical protein